MVTTTRVGQRIATTPNVVAHDPVAGSRMTAAATSVTAASALQDTLELGRANIQETLTNQTRSRGMPGYLKALGGLAGVLRTLSEQPGAHWLDAGGGAGAAVFGFMEYGVNSFTAPEYRNGSVIEPPKLPPKQLSATLLDLDCPTRPSGRIAVLTGRFVEQIPDTEMPKSNLITDVEGPFSYSARPDLVLQRYVNALTDDGVLLLGLGSTVNLTMPGRDSRVIGADGVVRTYVEWLQSIPGLEVTPHTVSSPDPEDHWETLSVEIRRRPGAKVEIPALTTVAFEGGGPPRATLREAAGDLSTNPAAQATTQQESQQALASAARALSTEQFLDQFRDGGLDNPVALALARHPGAWRHAGQLGESVLADLRAGKISGSEKFPLGSRLTGLVAAGIDSVDVATLDSPAAVKGCQNLAVITDQGLFAASPEPSALLRSYLDALSDKGELLLAFGAHGTGVARRSRVLTRKGKDLGLADWLATIPGLQVELHTQRGASYAEDRTYARIRIKDRAAISIRTLEPLGAVPVERGPHPILFREDLSEPAPQPTFGDTMNGLALRAWKALW